MQDFLLVTGIVIKVIPVGEYDKHICLLTKERGKITAYANGARRQNNRLMAGTELFCFGTFKLYVQKNSYKLVEADISQYFEGFRTDLTAAYYGMYFLEMMDYYTQENNDEVDMLKLLYLSLRELIKDRLPNKLIRRVFEEKTFVIQGEFPGIPQDGTEYQEATKYAVSYVMNTELEKLYSFNLSEEVLAEYARIMEKCAARLIDRKFHSLEMLSVFE